MKHIKQFTKHILESVKYELEPDEYTDESTQKTIVDGIIREIEDATGEGVTEVYGDVTETDSELTFTLSDGVDIYFRYIYHGFEIGLTEVKVLKDGRSKGEKSWGKSPSGRRGEDSEYLDLDSGRDIYQAVKDIYLESGLKEITYTHEIKLPKELFSNSPYFHYDSDESTDQQSVYFENEEAAQNWIKSLRIIKAERY